MAIEVQRQHYVFQPSALDNLPLPDIPASFNLSDEVRKMEEGQESTSSPPISPPCLYLLLPPEVPFRYNPLHDLESLWWVAVYFVFKREIDIDVERSDQAAERREAQRWAANNLFQSQDTRDSTITKDRFEDYLKYLHPSTRPIGDQLNKLRRKLAAAYRNAEEDAASIDHTAADGLHEAFSTSFRKIVKYLRKKPINLQPADIEPISSGRKHSLHSSDLSNSFTPPRKKARRIEPPPPAESSHRLTRSRAAALAKREQRQRHAQVAAYRG